MENIQYAQELVREFLVFRGFTNTLQSFETELATDIAKGFQVEKLLNLIFYEYIPKFQVEKLLALINFFKHYFISSTETSFLDTFLKLEVSVLRFYVVNAVRFGRIEKVVEFFGIRGNELMLNSTDWTPWFGRYVSDFAI